MSVFECTKDHPWDGLSRKGERVLHRDAKEVDIDSDYKIAYKCPHCGKYWEEELPE
jgi:hypothetical protein